MSDLALADVALLEAPEMDAWESIFAAAPAPLAKGLRLDVCRFGPALATAAGAIDIGQFNRIQGIGLPGDEDGDSIEAAVAWFRDKGVRNFLVQIPPGPRSPEFAERASALGLTPFRRAWTKFRRPPLPPPAAPTELRVIEAAAAHARDFGETAAAGFGMPSSLAPWLSALVGRPAWRCYVSYDGEAPVGVGAAFRREGAAWLGVGASLPQGRGRGSQSAILARRIADAVADGAPFLVTETGSRIEGEPQTSFGNILKSGFEIAYERANWTGP
jgi:hypothetical protein